MITHIGKVIAITCIATILAVLTRKGLYHFFPSLQGTVKPAVTPVVTDMPKAKPPEAPLTQQQHVDEKDKVYPTGRVWNKHDVLIVMSDGTVRSPADNTPGAPARLERVSAHFIDWKGDRYYFKPHTEALSGFDEKIRREAAERKVAPPPAPPADHPQTGSEPEATAETSVTPPAHNMSMENYQPVPRVAPKPRPKAH